MHMLVWVNKVDEGGDRINPVAVGWTLMKRELYFIRVLRHSLLTMTS